MHMPLSIRLGPEVDRFLDGLVQSGKYPNKAAAIREALNDFQTIEAAKEQGFKVLVVPAQVASKMDVAVQL